MKCFLEDCYPHFKSQIVHANSIDDVLDVVRDHCTVIDISCLESIVERFDIKEAEIHIQRYKDVVQSFIEQTKASFAIKESFKATKIPSLDLKYETADFVLN